MNVIQFAPRPTADAGLFEPLRSLAGLRPGDSIEQTGKHAARLFIEIASEVAGIDIRLDGRTLVVLGGNERGAKELRRYDLADGVSVTATRRTSTGFEVEFVRDEGRHPARASIR